MKKKPRNPHNPRRRRARPLKRCLRSKCPPGSLGSPRNKVPIKYRLTFGSLTVGEKRIARARARQGGLIERDAGNNELMAKICYTCAPRVKSIVFFFYQRRGYAARLASFSSSRSRPAGIFIQGVEARLPHPASNAPLLKGKRVIAL